MDVPILGEALIVDTKALIGVRNPLIDDREPLIAMSLPLIVDKKPQIAAMSFQLKEKSQSQVARPLYPVFAAVGMLH